MLQILIFAHVPPPHHGQSYMVAQLLDALRESPGEVTVYHVDSRVSDDMEQVGKPGSRKVLRLLRHCGKAIWLRLRHGPMVFYYVPAPAKRAALYRDWLVMLLCRPFFRRRLVFHWHAVGLGEWVQTKAGVMSSWITRRLLGEVDLSLVLATAVASDAEVLAPRRVVVLPNGIPDPCPDFTKTVLAARVTRLIRRNEESGVFRVLFLAHCTKEKGLYDALEGVFLAQRQLDDEKVLVQLSLTVAGQFLSVEEQEKFLRKVAELTEAWGEAFRTPSVQYVGFASGAEKDRLFRENDCFCFPTYYPNEVMPVTLIEALAYGMPIVSTRWRAIPEMLPAEGCILVEPHQPDQVAAALRQSIGMTVFPSLREYFLAHFQRDVFGCRLSSTLLDCFAETRSTLAGLNK